MEACNDISFKYADAVVDNIEMILFNVVGQIKWAGPIRQVGVGPNKAVLKSVCDSKTSIKISIRSETLINEIVELKTYYFQNLVVQHYQGIKLASTTNTSLNNVDEDVAVDWDSIKVKVDINKLCCLTISCVKSSTFYLCISLSCRKKVTPYTGETTVTCSNPGFKRKILVKRCKASYKVDGTFHTDGEQQQTLTI